MQVIAGLLLAEGHLNRRRSLIYRDRETHPEGAPLTSEIQNSPRVVVPHQDDVKFGTKE
jgi:hypothetical protein